eukprot:gene7811-12284_t
MLKRFKFKTISKIGFRSFVNDSDDSVEMKKSFEIDQAAREEFLIFREKATSKLELQQTKIQNLENEMDHIHKQIKIHLKAQEETRSEIELLNSNQKAILFSIVIMYLILFVIKFTGNT